LIALAIASVRISECRSEPPIDLDREPKSDIGVFRTVSGCDSLEQNSYSLVTLRFGLPSYEHESRSISLGVFVMFAKKVVDDFCLRVTDAKSFLRESHKVKGVQEK